MIVIKIKNRKGILPWNEEIKYPVKMPDKMSVFCDI